MNLRTTAQASALFAALTTWSTPALPATLSGGAPAVGASELGRLADLDAMLRHDLRAEQQRLESGCEFAMVRERLASVRDEAMGAVRQLGTLWREGRTRDGGFAMSELLVYNFATLVDEARRDSALADTLALLQDETRQGSPDARALIERMIEIHPAAPSCLTRALDEQDRESHVAGPVIELEPVLFTEQSGSSPK